VSVPSNSLYNRYCYTRLGSPTSELFRDANNTLNVSEHDIGAQLVLKALLLEFPGFIADQKTTTGRVTGHGSIKENCMGI
jgi:hypothetical protein